MFNPKLRIPEQSVVDDNYRGLIPDEISIQNWLNERDLLDTKAFLETLVELNRVQCEPSDRMTIMAILDVEIEKELKDLYEQTELITFPITVEHQSLIDTLQHILLESSLAYQIIIHDIANNEDYVNQYLGTLIPDSLFMAFFYLSQLLVERFQFYLSEPQYIWQELNQLFLLAERIGAMDDIVGSRTSIKHKYLQIVILKLLNPYRLMSNETRKIYQLLEKWVGHCEIIGYSQRSPENNFVVNLVSDRAPHFYHEKDDNKNNNPKNFEGRIITMDKLRIFIDEYLSRVEQQKRSHVFSYQSRMHNEMLRRIDNDLTIHEERAEERVLMGNEIKLVSGLRACHHFISRRKNFEPQAEIDAQQQQELKAVEKDDSEMNLISLLEEERLLNKKNPMGELQSVNPFMEETEVIGDEWNHIHANSVLHAHALMGQEHLNQTMKEESWKQRNESAHGMLLVAKNDIEMPIAVGMLVAYRLNVEKAYCLAMVKWLRINPHKGLAIGLKLIAVQSKAIAVKGEEGVGSGGQWHRAFLISENDTKGKGGKLQLIVPTGIYDSGSVIQVWHNNKLNRVKINRILSATDSFEQVAFKVKAKKK